MILSSHCSFSPDHDHEWVRMLPALCATCCHCNTPEGSAGGWAMPQLLSTHRFSNSVKRKYWSIPMKVSPWGTLQAWKMLKSHGTVISLQNRGVGLMPMCSAYRKLLWTAISFWRGGWFLQSALAGSGGVSLWGRPAWWLDPNQLKKAWSK